MNTMRTEYAESWAALAGSGPERIENEARVAQFGNYGRSSIR
jgi:hypothetical protein